MPDITKDINNIRFYRNVKRYMTGFDVDRIKRRLLALGYLSTAKEPKFGDGSYEAVKTFQARNGLEDDGIVGPITWKALFDEDAVAKGTTSVTESSEAITIPTHFTKSLQVELADALEKVTGMRRTLCLRALNYAVDPYHPGSYPRSLYIRGGNLFNKDLSENVITAARIESGAASQSEFYNNGRKEFMLCAVQNNPAITGADCSGGIVGLWRKEKVKAAGFDANANTLYARHCEQTDDQTPGDLAWKSGHIGLFVGAGRIVEWAGGAYGCQLTKANDRRCYDYVKEKISKMSAWQAFGDPKGY